MLFPSWYNCLTELRDYFFIKSNWVEKQVCFFHWILILRKRNRLHHISSAVCHLVHTDCWLIFKQAGKSKKMKKDITQDVTAPVGLESISWSRGMTPINTHIHILIILNSPCAHNHTCFSRKSSSGYHCEIMPDFSSRKISKFFFFFWKKLIKNNNTLPTT